MAEKALSEGTVVIDLVNEETRKKQLVRDREIVSTE